MFRLADENIDWNVMINSDGNVACLANQGLVRFHHHEQIVIAIFPCVPRRTRAEEDDLLRTKSRDDLVDDRLGLRR